MSHEQSLLDLGELFNFSNLSTLTACYEPRLCENVEGA